MKLSKENKNEKIVRAIPKVKNCVDNYYTLSIEDKNKLLKCMINKVYYLKENGGRWNKDNIDNFTLEIDLKI